MSDTGLGLIKDVETIESWEAYLDDFRQFYWPMFEKHGFRFPEAFLVWKLNQLDNHLSTFEVEDES